MSFEYRVNTIYPPVLAQSEIPPTPSALSFGFSVNTRQEHEIELEDSDINYAMSSKLGGALQNLQAFVEAA